SRSSIAGRTSTACRAPRPTSRLSSNQRGHENARCRMRNAFCIQHSALQTVMNIPYTVEERPDTGLANGKLGIWLFLASEVMLFGALFSTYIILRMGATEWPHHDLNIWLGMINTFILIASSVTMVMAWAELKLHNWAKHRLYL